MTTDVESWVNDLRLLPDDEVVRHRNWGFTIYRSDYGPSSDQHWQRLLQTIQTHAYKGALGATDSTEDDPRFRQLWSLFRLDARSDPALAGLDMDQLRELYNGSDGGQAMNSNHNSHHVFILADDEVLSDPAASTVKCVDADYRAKDHIPRNNWTGGQRYFGWMPMSARSIAELWIHLDLFDMSTIAPPTIGGSHLVVWDRGH